MTGKGSKNIRNWEGQSYDKGCMIRVRSLESELQWKSLRRSQMVQFISNNIG